MRRSTTSVHACERLRLDNVARDTVQHETGRFCLALQEVLPQDFHDDVVWNELPAVHITLRQAPDLGAVARSGAEGVPGRDVGDPVKGGKARSLGPLARSLPTEHHDPGGPIRVWPSNPCLSPGTGHQPRTGSE
jgi:hypothetical protein